MVRVISEGGKVGFITLWTPLRKICSKGGPGHMYPLGAYPYAIIYFLAFNGVRRLPGRSFTAGGASARRDSFTPVASHEQIDERRRMVALDPQCSRGMYGVHPGTVHSAWSREQYRSRVRSAAVTFTALGQTIKELARVFRVARWQSMSPASGRMDLTSQRMDAIRELLTTLLRLTTS